MMRKHRRLIVLALGLLAALALLAFDLSRRGAVWTLFWNLTGEERPLSQLIGMVELGSNLFRQPPAVAGDIPIQHAEVSPYGINTFLQQEVEIEKRERSLSLIAQAGFRMIRQQFPWEDIEIHARGDFTDRRNDLNGDGLLDERDTISAWDKYDNIVALAEQFDIEIQARLDNPPAWTHVRNPDIGSSAPPDDFQDFVNFAAAVAERYRGRIRYYQVWNEPNIYPEWGNQPVDPVGYTELLCRTYAALKAVDPKIVVISGPLSPTVSLTPENLSDLIFLQRMYDAGAGACFDVMSAQGYGFFSGPTDRRLRPLTLTYARHLYIRDIMVANGDAHKALWISEAAWNAQPDDPTIIQSGAFGIVSEDEAARYMPLAYQRALEEWPWIGNISYWFFKRPADYERNQAFYYFRMMEPDFTPLPVYDSMRQYIVSQLPTLFPGVHQAEDWAISHRPGFTLRTVAGAQFDTVVQSVGSWFRAHGTLAVIRWRGTESLSIQVGEAGPPLVFEATGSGWRNARVALADPAARVVLSSAAPFELDSIRVADRRFAEAYPVFALLAVVIVSLLLPLLHRPRSRA